MELRNIQYFIAIAEEQSFSKAALRLGISQPPLSMQIKKLEREIGVELFYRYSHGVALTPAGETFLKMVLPCSEPTEKCGEIDPKCSKW